MAISLHKLVEKLIQRLTNWQLDIFCIAFKQGIVMSNSVSSTKSQVDSIL